MLTEEGNMFFTNLLPPVTPVDSCQANQSCLDVSTHSLQRSGSSSDYVNIVELPNSERNENAAHGNQVIVENETGNENSDSVMPQNTASSTVSASSNGPQSGSTTPVRMSSQANATIHNEISDTVTEMNTTPSRMQDSRQLSNLDRSKRTVCQTLSSPGESPVVVRRRLGESPLARRKDITSSPVHPRGELGALQPLSPEHGTQMSDQYEFLRRTLSHSHRRYSTRRRPNRKGRRTEETGGEREGGEGESAAAAATSTTEVSTPEQQRWRDILISTEVSPTARRSEGVYTQSKDHYVLYNYNV